MPVYTQTTMGRSTKIVASNSQEAIASTQQRATTQQRGIDVIDSSDRLVASVAPKPSETVVSTWVKR